MKINTKNMTQKEFDNYLLLDLMEDVNNDYDDVAAIILKGKQFYFGRICPNCNDLILIPGKHDLNKILAKKDIEDIIRYLEVLTNLDVFDYEDANLCECEEDDLDINDDINTEKGHEKIKSEGYGEDDDLDEDDDFVEDKDWCEDDDYGDGNDDL